MNYFYYDEDKRTFPNRIQAVQHSIKTNKRVYLHYYDEVYDKLNWKIEPPETLQYYYKEQAQRIRDQYDYLILCYSGGYDSTNILETFHFNNIKLDKIVCVGALSQDSHSGVDENHNGELYHNSFPYLRELGLESITQVIDYTNMFDDISKFSIYKLGDQWVEHIGSKYSPHNWFWRDLDSYVVPKSHQDKKIGIIFGCDKPYLSFRNDKRFFQFMDTPVTSYSRFDLNKIHDSHFINFYWDPTYPFILLKQLHTLKKSGYTNILGHDHVNNVVYNLRKPLIHKSPKSGTAFLSLRDTFLMTKNDQRLSDFFNSGIKNISNIQYRLNNVPSKIYEIE